MTINRTSESKLKQWLNRLLFGFKYKLKILFGGLAILLAMALTLLWLVASINPMQALSRLTGAFETKPAFGFVAAERTFEGFQSMTCGEQTYDAALMTGDSSENLLVNAVTQDLVSGKASGMVSIAVSFERTGFVMTPDHESKTVTVSVPGDSYVIYRPAVTDFTDEVHAQGLMTMFSSEESIIGRVIRDGTVALGQQASQQGGSWYEDCRDEIASAWSVIAGVFGYTVVIDIEPPAFPLEVHYGDLPYDVQSVADVIAQAVETEQ